MQTGTVLSKWGGVFLHFRDPGRGERRKKKGEAGFIFSNNIGKLGAQRDRMKGSLSHCAACEKWKRLSSNWFIKNPTRE